MTEGWHEEYAQLMFGPEHSKFTMDSAAEIKYFHMPEVLYKYRAADEKTLDALSRGVLYSSPAQYLNDPFEAPIIVSDKAKAAFYQVTYNNLRNRNSALPAATVTNQKELLDNLARSFGGSYEDLKQNCSSFPTLCALSVFGDELVQRAIQSSRKQAKNMYNICSLTSDLHSPLMWSYYAEGHSGFCIGYRIKERGITDTLVQLTLPVLYGNNCVITVDNIDDINGSICMYAMSWKTSVYAPEKEWRLFYKNSSKPRAETMPPPAAVYLGAKIDPDKKVKLCEICGEKKIPVFQMQVDEGKQRLYETSITK